MTATPALTVEEYRRRFRDRQAIIVPPQRSKSAGQRERELVEAVRAALHPWPVRLWTDDSGTGRIRVGVGRVFVDVYVDHSIPLEALAFAIIDDAVRAWHARPAEPIPDTVVLGQE